MRARKCRALATLPPIVALAVYEDVDGMKRLLP